MLQSYMFSVGDLGFSVLWYLTPATTTGCGSLRAVSMDSLSGYYLSGKKKKNSGKVFQSLPYLWNNNTLASKHGTFSDMHMICHAWPVCANCCFTMDAYRASWLFR